MLPEFVLSLDQADQLQREQAKKRERDIDRPSWLDMGMYVAILGDSHELFCGHGGWGQMVTFVGAAEGSQVDGNVGLKVLRLWVGSNAKTPHLLLSLAYWFACPLSINIVTYG